MDTQIRRRSQVAAAEERIKSDIREQYRKAIAPAAGSFRIERPAEELAHEKEEVRVGRLPF